MRNSEFEPGVVILGQNYAAAKDAEVEKSEVKGQR